MNTVDTTREQSDNAYMRERFLKLLTQLNKKECTVKMHENTEVKCVIKAFDPQLENVVVEKLVTPRPEEIKSAVLRVDDIISMHFKVD